MGQKVGNFASFSTSLKFEPPRLKMKQGVRTLKWNQRSDDRPIFLPSWVKLGPCAPGNSCQFSHQPLSP